MKHRILVTCFSMAGLMHAPSSQAFVDCSLPIAAATGVLVAASDVLATLNLALFDYGSIDIATGGPTSMARILRQIQATDVINNTKEIKSNQANLEGVRNGMVHYNQQAEQLELYRRAITEFPDATPITCAEWNLRQGMGDATVARNNHILSGIAKGSARNLTQKNLMQEVIDIKKDVIKDAAGYSGSVLTRYGCTAVYDPAITAFETKTPIPIGWDCPKQEPSYTISTKDFDKAQKTLNRILNPFPAPLLPVGSRKTPAGQSYEVLVSNTEKARSFIAASAHGALANYAPVRKVSDLQAIYTHYKIDMTGVTDLSVLGDIAKRNTMRFDNQEFKEELRRMQRKNVLIEQHHSQLNKLRMVFLMYEQEHRQFLATMSSQGVVVADAAQTKRIKSE